jgi:hypothetical protein
VGELSADLPPAADLTKAREEWGTGIQAWLGVVRVDFEKGQEWRVVPRDDASSAEEALYIPKPTGVSRGLLVAMPPAGAKHRVCLDDAGFEYSEGALVPVRAERGHFAICRSGALLEAPADSR